MGLSLAEMGAKVLNTADGRAKTALSLQYAQAWQKARAAGNMLEIGTAPAPDHPARPEAPRLCAPKDVAKRKPGSPEGRIALLHAVAHYLICRNSSRSNGWGSGYDYDHCEWE